MKLFIDIETIPCQSEQVISEIKKTVKPPGNIKKPESITKWREEKGLQAENEAILKTSFNGLLGEIIVIGVAIDDMDIISFKRSDTTSEKNIIDNFFTYVTEIAGNLQVPEWVGHNECEFDLRFLFHRCLVNEIYPKIPIPYNDKPWSKNVFDTLYEVMGNNKSGGSLNAISKALGIGHKLEGMSGDQVWPEYQNGNIDKIAEYCRHDVYLVREIYKRINFTSKVDETLNPYE